MQTIYYPQDDILEIRLSDKPEVNLLLTELRGFAG